MRVGVVIPAYNAEHTLAGVLARIPVTLRLTHVCIVNDGSTDATGRVARELAGRPDDRWQQLEPLDLARNRGYGGAVKHGLLVARRAGMDVVCCLHADGQYAPEELPAMIATLADRGLDLLQGSRIASGTALSGGMPLYKYIAGRALTALENRVLGLEMTDYHSGYMVYGPRALESLPLERLSDGFDFDLEVIATARAHGLRIGERAVPTHYGDEVSHLAPVRYGLRVLGVMLNYRAGLYHRLATGR